jgi:ArsR family transcriptional regulator, arsenate/arsenite/antimonite-responsive transcriptional repressor / arsenate reductase (thioredoxin)
MDKIRSLDALSALSQETRLDVFRLLTRAEPAGMVAGDIADAMGARQNTISTNLAILAHAGLIRSVREGRNIRYFADLEGMRGLLSYLMEDCCEGKPEACAPLLGTVARACGRKPEALMPDKVFNVLFLCAGNSARSIMAEAILNRWGQGRFRAFSAGSQARRQVHPYTLDLLRMQNFDVSFARSKSWDEFARPEAPELDFVFSVCDTAAGEVCPAWPGQPMTAHWGIPDPAAATGTEAERRLAFADAFRQLNNRISIFVALPLASLDRLTLQKRLDDIGTVEGATHGKPSTANRKNTLSPVQ